MAFFVPLCAYRELHHNSDRLSRLASGDLPLTGRIICPACTPVTLTCLFFYWVRPIDSLTHTQTHIFSVWTRACVQTRCVCRLKLPPPDNFNRRTSLFLQRFLFCFRKMSKALFLKASRGCQRVSAGSLRVFLLVPPCVPRFCLCMLSEGEGGRDGEGNKTIIR